MSSLFTEDTEPVEAETLDRLVEELKQYDRQQQADSKRNADPADIG